MDASVDTDVNVGCGRQTFLVVFDFDHTILDCNSDVNIPKYLGRADLQEKLIQQKLQWTNLISALLAPFSAEEIAVAARESVVVHPGIQKMFKFLMSLQDYHREHNIQETAPFLEIHIASDANHLFIQEIFAEHFPFLKVASIHTNGYQDMRGVVPEEVCEYTGEVRKSKLLWYEPQPGHDCPLCNFRGRPHMCKSRIIQRCLGSSKLVDPTVIFVGDGGNDYCPIVNCLRPRDYVFARRHYPLAKDLSLRRGGCCHVRLWENGDSLHHIFRSVLLDRSLRLPTLVRTGDMPVTEFRHMSVVKRWPVIIRRVLAENDAFLSATAKKELEMLIVAMEQCGEIRGLPTQALPPQWVMNYRGVPLCGFNGIKADDAPTWGQVPWCHGEIYSQLLLLHIAHLTESPVTLGDDELLRLCVTPFAVSSPLLGLSLNVTRELHGESSVEPRHVNKEPGDIDHPAHRTVMANDLQRFDPNFLGSAVPTGRFAPLHDIFAADKRSVLKQCLASHITPMAESGLWRKDQSTTVAAARLLLRSMLWGNSVDLCFKEIDLHKDTQHVGKDERILCNQIEEIVKYLHSKILPSNVTVFVDIILDNAAVELMADMAFALWVVENSSSAVVSLHGKPAPFYVSDVNKSDLEDLLCTLEEAQCRHSNEFAKMVRHHLTVSKRIHFYADPCWVAPLEFRELPPKVVNTFFYTQHVVDPADSTSTDDISDADFTRQAKVEHFGKSSLVITKGDLNFRRLIGDRHWDRRSFFSTVKECDHAAEIDALCIDSKFARAPPTLRQAIEDYWPVNVVPVAALRTAKSELCCGIPIDVVDKMDHVGPADWRVNGDYAVALFSGFD